MKPSEHLKRALQLYETGEVEWKQGALFDIDPKNENQFALVRKCCVIGSLALGAYRAGLLDEVEAYTFGVFHLSNIPSLWKQREPYYAMVRAREKLTSILAGRAYVHGLVVWNDTEGRKKEEVLALLREAIEQLEAEDA